MAEQVPAPPAPNQVQDVVNVAPAPKPVLAVPVALVENRLSAAVDDVAQNAAPDSLVTIPSF